MSFQEARKAAGLANGQARMERDLPVWQNYPDLYECLNGFTDDKGKTLKGCKFTVYIETGSLKICLNDPLTGMVAFACLSVHCSLSDALEEVLGGPGLEWRKGRGKP